MWQNRSSAAVAALLAASVGLLNGCSREVARSHAIARCEAGALVVHENIVERHGFSGATKSVRQSLMFHTADGRRVPVQLSERGSYRPPARDRLAVLREPREGDWQAYVDPGNIDPKGYTQLVACLEMGSIEAGPAQAVLPTIATFRYASLEQLRRRYQCGNDARLEVREDGLVYLHADASVLVGAIVDAGTVVALDAGALSYLSSRDLMPIRDPLSRFRHCRETSGAKMFDQFKISVCPEGTFWTMLETEQNVRRRVYRERSS